MRHSRCACIRCTRFRRRRINAIDSDILPQARRSTKVALRHARVQFVSGFVADGEWCTYRVSLHRCAFPAKTHSAIDSDILRRARCSTQVAPTHGRVQHVSDCCRRIIVHLSPFTPTGVTKAFASFLLNDFRATPLLISLLSLGFHSSSPFASLTATEGAASRRQMPTTRSSNGRAYKVLPNEWELDF